MVRVIVPAALPYITANGYEPAVAGSGELVLSPYVMKWPVGKGNRWVYLDSFTKSVSLAAPPAALMSLPPELKKTLVTQRVLMPSQFDLRGEVLGYVESIRRHVFYLEIANTHRCNLGCFVCYRDSPGVDHRSDMTPEVAKRLIDWVRRRIDGAEFSELCVDFLGGEPLMAADVLLELVCELRESARAGGLDFEANLVTNATLLTAALSRKLARAGLTGVQFTFEGPPSVHNARRGVERGQPGSFQAQVRLLSELVQLDYPIRRTVRVNYDRHNFSYLPALFRHLSELEAIGCFHREDLFVSPVVKVFPDRHGHIDTHAFPPMEAARMMGEVLQARLEAGLGIAVGDLVPEYPCRFYVCDGYSVDALGRFFTCGSLIGTCGFVASLDEPPGAPNWRRADLSQECLACPLLATCFGGCPNEGPMSQAGLNHCPREFIEEYLRAIALCLGAAAEKGSV